MVFGQEPGQAGPGTKANSVGGQAGTVIRPRLINKNEDDDLKVTKFIHEFIETYHWTIDQVLDTPKPILDRLLLAITESKLEKRLLDWQLAGADINQVKQMESKFAADFHSMKQKLLNKQVEAPIDPNSGKHMDAEQQFMALGLLKPI